MKIDANEKWKWFDTAEQCADAAAPVFQMKNWRWTRGVPSRDDILRKLNELSSLNSRNQGVESGRLYVHNGRFAYAKY